MKWFEPFTFVLPLGCLHSNDALWFLSSLFLVNVIFFIVNRRLSGKRLFVFILLCYLYSFVDSKILPCVFNSSNVSLGIVYFYGGYMFRKASMKYSIFRVWYFILACVLYVLIMTFVFNVCIVRAGKWVLYFEFSILHIGNLYIVVCFQETITHIIIRIFWRTLYVVVRMAHDTIAFSLGSN